MIKRLAPAKINLCLRVLGRRADGYHEVDSLMLPLELGDEVGLELTLDAPLAVSCSCPGHPSLEGESNLAARAARRYLERARLPARATITVEKRIWVAAGLGGGSSDAAAVLQLLDDQLHALSRAELFELAAGLGADVPFFLGGSPARARGRGDLLEPLPTLPRLDLVLLNPGTALPTPDVYAGLGLRPGERTGAAPLPPVVPDQVLELVHNDLAPIAERLCPPIGELKARLLAAGARCASVTGSGPTVFGVFEGLAAAHEAADKLGNMSGFSVAQTATACA